MQFRTLVVVACALIGSGSAAMAGQLSVLVEDVVNPSSTEPINVFPGQTVGGRVFFWEVFNHTENWYLNGTSTFSMDLSGPSGTGVPVPGLAFTPDLAQISAVSNGSNVQVTFGAMPLSLAQPDPFWTSVLYIGHWSWTVDSAAIGLTVLPSFGLEGLALDYSLPPYSHYPIGSYTLAASHTYFVVPGPECAASMTMGIVALVGRKRPSRKLQVG